MSRRALFLDRDGVINLDHGYVYQPDNIQFVDGIFDLCRTARALDYRIIVVTNQAGIGRGYFTEAQFHTLTRWMCDEFLAQQVEITQVYFCPFHPEFGIGPYKQASSFRKPGPGMILQALREHGLSPHASILVGDKASDIEAGRAAGIGCNILYAPTANAAHMADTLCVSSLADVKKYLTADR